jgi:hypothetical protein
LGFDVVYERLNKLATELGLSVVSKYRGTMKMLSEYNNVVNVVKERHLNSGFKSKTGLYQPFIGHEGRRVEVFYHDGSSARFYIGRSTGWIPCHLEIKQSNSTGGGSVCGSLIKSFRFL